MKRYLHLIWTVSMCGSTALLVGCEDSDSRQRNDVQAQIRVASSNLQTAIAKAAEEDGSTQPLNGVVSELSRIETTAPGQSAAKAMLSATAQREIARIRLQNAADLEAAQSQQRRTLHTRLTGISKIRSMVDAIESVTAVQERETLRNELESARTKVIEVRQQIDQLDGPVSEHTMANTASKQEVDALRLQVNELRRRAQELGHADGFSTYQQAITASRQADKIEYEISHREIDLDYSLTPELVLTDTQAQQLDSMIQAIESALAQLNAYTQATAEQVSISRKLLADESALVTAGLQELEAARTNDLDPAYAEATGALEKAGGQLRQVQGDSASSARLTAVEVLQTLGASHWARARSIGEHLQLLQTIAGEGGDIAKLVSQANIQTLQASHAEALQMARDAYTSAQEIASGLTGRGDSQDINRLSSQLGQAVSSLGGTPAATDEFAPAESVASTDEVATESTATPTFNTPEELFAYLSQLPLSIAGTQASIAVTHATTPDGLRTIEISRKMGVAFGSIDDAMKAKFGTGLMEAMGPMAAAFTPDYTQATLVTPGEDQAVYRLDMMGQGLNIAVRRVDGSWKFDADQLDPMVKASLSQQEQMAEAMAQSASGIVARIQSGEIKSSQEVVAALGQLMMGG